MAREQPKKKPEKRARHGTEKKPDEEPSRPAIHDEGLESLRDRLYSRSRPVQRVERKPFSELHHPSPRRKSGAGDISRQTSTRTLPASVPATQPHEGLQQHAVEQHDRTTTMAKTSAQHESFLSGYRMKVAFGALGFFAFALILSSLFLFFGQNTISGTNISIGVDAPVAVAGGEALELVIAVTNHNSVPIESATLIVEYPPGTQAVDESREIFRERNSLGDLAPEETLTVPLSARVFGEENDERVVAVSVEYRVEGSNATFFREADPVRIKISSSPVILSLESVREVSSGQEFVLELDVVSNSPAPLTDLIVEATYPQGFEVICTTPAPVKGQSIWRISELTPESETTITVRGALEGASAGERVFEFVVGVPDERDRFGIASALASAETTVELTDPFVGLSVSINGSAADAVSVDPDETVTVFITFLNTLSETIYDGVIEVALAGNGLDPTRVSAAGGGFFDSASRTVRWDGADVPGLSSIAPGQQEEVRFTIRGAAEGVSRTPAITLDISAAGRRVSESRVPQELSRIESRTIRFASVTSLDTHALHSVGPFSNGGPVPPEAERETEYAVLLTAKNGSNELADASVTLSLPSYVSWRSRTSGDGSISYNPSRREVTWTMGTVAASAAPTAAFQLAFTPSVSQVGTVPTIAGVATLRATDRFTGTSIRAVSPALTTRLLEDPDPDAQSGRVER